jgi:hypothetical protein
LAVLEVKHGDQLIALDCIALAIRHYHDAGSVAFFHTPLATLALILDRLGHFESAAKLVGFPALSPMIAAAFPDITTVIAHVKENLGAQTFDSLALMGETMTPANMVTYAYSQIDLARAELERLK